MVAGDGVLGSTGTRYFVGRRVHMTWGRLRVLVASSERCTEVRNADMEASWSWLPRYRRPFEGLARTRYLMGRYSSDQAFCPNQPIAFGTVYR